MKKYELVEDDIITIQNYTLYRIRALRDFGSVFAGELGGYIEKEENLSHGGTCWISGDARILGDAKIRSFRDYIVFKNNWSSGRHFTYTKSNKMWAVGCFYGTSQELIEKAYQDSQESGDMYKMYVEFVEKMEEKMNKQEAKKHIENMGEYERFVDEPISKIGVLNIINKIDESKKVKVPQFVADWIEKHKEEWWLGAAFCDRENYKFREWLIMSDKHTRIQNQDTFARAWLDGYEVEQEKLYRVPLKGFVSSNGQQYLTKESSQSSNFFARALNRSLIQKFTMNEIPEEYRQWAEEVE